VRVSDFFSAGADADAVIARVEQQMAAAQEQAQRAQAFQDQVKAVRGTARSPRGHVEVTVDASGRLAAIDLADAAFDLSARELGALIVQTSDAAQRAAGAQALELAGEAFGKESSVVDRLRAELDEEPPSAAFTEQHR
jgi:DNA-binding protein YbaB